MFTKFTRKIDRRSVKRTLSQQSVCRCGEPTSTIVRYESGLVARCMNCLVYGYPTK